MLNWKRNFVLMFKRVSTAHYWSTIFRHLSNPFPSKPSIVFSPYKPFYTVSLIVPLGDKVFLVLISSNLVNRVPRRKQKVAERAPLTFSLRSCLALVYERSNSPRSAAWCQIPHPRERQSQMPYSRGKGGCHYARGMPGGGMLRLQIRAVHN